MRETPTPRPARPARLAGLAILLAAAAGCGGKYTPVPVSGVVTLDGKPVEGATVYFYAVGDEKEGRPAHGTTDKNGEFRLSTLGHEDGALPRNYKVVVTKYVPTLPNLKMPDFPDTLEGRRRERLHVPELRGQGHPAVQELAAGEVRRLGHHAAECNVTGRTTVKFELTGN